MAGWLWVYAVESTKSNWFALHKKRSFPLRISSVNVTKSAVSCGFGHIYWKNPELKTSFFVQWWERNGLYSKNNSIASPYISHK